MAEPVAASPRVSWLDRIRNRDHTSGSLLGSLLVLSFPSIAMSVFGMGLFQLVELRLLGELGSQAIAAVGSTNQVFRQTVMLAMVGLNAGSQMLIARAVGADDVAAGERAAGQTFVLGLCLAALTGLVGALFAEPLSRLLTGDPAIAALSADYLRILALTFGIAIGVQLFGSVLNGAGDTTTPMLVTLLITPASIGAQWVLAFGHVGAPALGVAGIAWGAAVGGAVGLALALWSIFSGRCRIRLARQHLRPDPALLQQLLAVSWQPAFHMVARTSLVLIFMLIAGRLGGPVQAAYTIGIRIELLGIMIAFPIANACATLVGQNLGAGRPERARASLWAATGLTALFLWPGALAIGLLRRPIVGVFTSDPAVVPLAEEYLVYAAVILAFYGFYFVAFRALQASGDMLAPMVISVTVALLIGAPLGGYLATATSLGATGMWIANLVYAVVNAGLMIGWLLTRSWVRTAARPT